MLPETSDTIVWLRAELGFESRLGSFQLAFSLVNDVSTADTHSECAAQVVWGGGYPWASAGRSSGDRLGSLRRSTTVESIFRRHDTGRDMKKLGLFAVVRSSWRVVLTMAPTSQATTAREAPRRAPEAPRRAAEEPRGQGAPRRAAEAPRRARRHHRGTSTGGAQSGSGGAGLAGALTGGASGRGGESGGWRRRCTA